MILATVVFIVFSNIWMITKSFGLEGYRVPVMIITGVLFFFFLAVPSFRKFPVRKYKRIQRGTMLLLEFLVTIAADAAVLIFMIANGSYAGATLGINTAIAVTAANFIFWNGIIRVYLNSAQLGFKWRVIGIVCGLIPIAHFVALGYIIRITRREYNEETERYYLNKKREADQVCRTRYPILMVHGVFFRDYRYFSYWGRIPDDLKKNGAVIYYGNQQSAASVRESGRELSERIKQIVEETGCGKVNIIAHSKGGLDCRSAISQWGAAPYVASLTTVNTPHRGCLFADYLLSKAPQKLKETVAAGYNAALRKLGDKDPDFLSAVTDLTNDACTKFNAECPDDDRVVYCSIGSVSKKARSGRFPLNLSYEFVNRFDGQNDGLVSLPSMEWGNSFTHVEPRKNRGITHGDMIDLNRENIDGFDVRETYVSLVSSLRERGL